MNTDVFTESAWEINPQEKKFQIQLHSNSNCSNPNFHGYVEAYRKQVDFIRKKSELLVVEVILEIDVNWSQRL